MSTIGRTIKNVLKAGPANSLKQMNNIGDTKWGAFIGADRFGNKYFENNDEISGTACRFSLTLGHMSLFLLSL